MTKLAGKVALVTGGARGIGRAICEAYAAAGAKFVVADISEDDAHKTAKAIGGLAVAMDVADMNSISAGIAAIKAEYGGIDILVNNAGIFNMASIDKITHEDYRQQYDVNVGGTIFTCQAAVPLMKRRGGGTIINFASQAGRRGEANVTIYCSTKAAVISITQSLALELASDNIRVNAIAPGAVLTERVKKLMEQDNDSGPTQDMIEKHLLGLGHPQQVATVALFFASEDSNWITGQVLPVDGGASVH